MSVLIGLIVAAVSTAMAVVVGRALPRMRERGAILTIFLITLFVPGTAMGVGMFLYYRSILDLRLGLWSLLLGHLAWAFPFALLSVLVVASRFDQRLLSAAADLGATPWQRFWQIELPLLRPGIVGGAIFAFLLSFNELPRSSYLRGVTTTLPLFEWAQATTQTSNIPFLFALSSVTLAVSLPLISVTTWILSAAPVTVSREEGRLSRDLFRSVEVAMMQRISNIIVAPTSAVIPEGSKGGETSTTSAPMISRPSSPLRRICASKVENPPTSGVPVPGAYAGSRPSISKVR